MTDDEFTKLHGDILRAESLAQTGTPEEKRDAIPRAIRLRREYAEEVRRRTRLTRSAAAGRG